MGKHFLRVWKNNRDNQDSVASFCSCTALFLTSTSFVILFLKLTSYATRLICPLWKATFCIVDYNFKNKLHECKDKHVLICIYKYTDINHFLFTLNVSIFWTSSTETVTFVAMLTWKWPCKTVSVGRVYVLSNKMRSSSSMPG